MERPEEIVMVVVCLVALVLGVRKARRIGRHVAESKTVDPDGSVREPTTSERIAIANKLVREKGKYFWWMVIPVILFITVLIILRIVGVLPIG
jgi:Mg2+/citrate symporter